MSDENEFLFASSIDEKASVNSNFATAGNEECIVEAKDILDIEELNKLNNPEK